MWTAKDADCVPSDGTESMCIHFKARIVTAWLTLSKMIDNAMPFARSSILLLQRVSNGEVVAQAWCAYGLLSD
jgi:hypothetical protein